VTLEERKEVDVVESTREVVVCDSCGQDADEFAGEARSWYRQPRVVVEGREHTGRRMLRYVEVNPTRFSTFLADDARVVDARVEVEHDGRVDLCPICAEVLSE